MAGEACGIGGRCDEELVRWLVFMPVDQAWAKRLAVASRAELEWTLRELRGRPLVTGKIKRVEARLRGSGGRLAVGRS